MRVPQVSERVKEAPAQALRAVFAGIGQVLLVADRMRNRQDTKPAGPASDPAPAEKAPPAAGVPAAQPPADGAAADPPAAPEPAAAKTAAAKTAAAKPAASKPAATKAAPAKPATSKPVAAKTSPAKPATAQPAAAEPAPAPPAPAPATSALPLPNYDELAVASLRARMRVLDQAQLRALIDYENSHAARADVVSMFERRIAKLETGG